MRRFLLAIAVMFLLIAPTRADEEPTARPGSSSPEESRVSADFRSAEFAEVICAIAKAGRMNVIVSPEVKGAVTISFKDRRPRAALDQVAARAGAHVEELDYGLLRVIPVGEAVLDPDCYRFQRWRPDREGIFSGDQARLFQWAIDPLVRKEGGEWRYVEKENAVYFTATRATLKIIRTILTAVDHGQS